MLKLFPSCFIITLLVLLGACQHGSTCDTSFYYWKNAFKLNRAQQTLLKQSHVKTVYVRYFDVKWNDIRKCPYPEAVVHLNKDATSFQIIPVIYITNRTFERLPSSGIDGLAVNCLKLVTQLCAHHNISPKRLQIDCDWTLRTKTAYFAFLAALKKRSSYSLEATIRLHQVKYGQITGVPPVDRGVLMFYNMEKLTPDLKQSNSIYNSNDAERYLQHLKAFPLPLDVALPAFSWAVHIRNSKIIQVYQKINREKLSNLNFQALSGTKNAFRAKKSFYMSGIYIKQNDIFKLEETDVRLLEQAAHQLGKSLPKDSKRTIIYYELSNIDTDKFSAEAIHEVSARF